MNQHDQSMYEELGTYCKNLQVISSSKEMVECSASFQFANEFVGFKGHFPDKPVLPAIGQLALVRYVSEKGLGIQLIPNEYNKTKFTGMILPGQELSVFIKLRKLDNRWVAEFRILQNNELKISSGEITFSI